MPKWLKLPDRPFHEIRRAPRCEIRKVALLGKTPTWRCDQPGDRVFVIPMNEEQNPDRRGFVLLLHVCGQHAAELGD
jgi:hypothetical protein